MDSVIEAIYITYLILNEELEEIDLIMVLVTFDIVVWGLNVYSILCVLSQYHRFKYANNETSSSTYKTNANSIELNFRA